MSSEITMPQLSDTMTEGTLVKWHKTEGQKVEAGEEIADVETDKATMPMEAFEDGVLAVIVAAEGSKVKVGGLIGVIAVGNEKPAEIKAKYAEGGGARKPEAATPAAPPKTPTPKSPSASAGSSPSVRSPSAPAGSSPSVKSPSAAPAPSVASKSPPAKTPSAKTAPAAPRPGAAAPSYQFDLIVIGGGPAGYAAAIRAGQLKKRVLCVEKQHLGGVCLNWGCIPTKALLESGAFIRRLREDSDQWGVSCDNVTIDFPKIIARSRGIAEKLSKGIAHLFRKHEVKHERATGQLLSRHRVKITAADGSAREVTARFIILATGARARSLPGIDIDHVRIITAKEAMNLPEQPKRIAIVGAGAIGCEFADFYNAIGTEIEIIELLDHLLPIEDTDCSVLLERMFTKRGIRVHTKSRTLKVEKTADGVRVHATSAARGDFTIAATLCLMAVGVTGNVEDLAVDQAKLELFKNHVKVDAHYKTNIDDVYAVGDVIGPPWLAHVAHHEAVVCVERIFGFAEHLIDYKMIPGCTYTHPQVASIGLTERKAREEKRDIRIGKFPFSASGRALAAGEADGFVKLIFDAKYGELLGAHLIGENVTELLGELIMAQKLEATEETILSAMHPHPTLSEAVMEAAGVADGRAIHL